AEQREGARMFRSFLLGRPQQEVALLRFGFRPANAGVPIVNDDPDNPFNRYQRFGVGTDVAGQVETPSPEILAILLEAWQQR
ncbi:MAG TPA: ABC transporter substrate-binding protein, partial [Roseiflexaceae bacterium]|nr:ABC transporter substrate-binding protein [Roseiflexaceae bacterium]